MKSLQEILPLLNSISLYKIVDDLEIETEQLGKNIFILDPSELPQDLKFQVAILGINDLFGSEMKVKYKTRENNIDLIRKELYFLYAWHSEVRILDLGNLTKSANIEEVYEKLKQVNTFCNQHNIILIVMGGPHNLLMGQFQSIKQQFQNVNFSNIDALVDLNNNKRFQEFLFLDSCFSNKNSGLSNYTHIGFQSYYTHPKILDILNKFKYNFFRLGYVKDNIFDIEPYIRNSNLVSVDMSSIINSKSVLKSMPNGFSGEDICLLMRFCGLSTEINSLGIYGYYSFFDDDAQTASLIAQMIWYFIEGLYYKTSEGNFDNALAYNTYFASIENINLIFYQSKVTKRWWMQLEQNKKIIPCSYNDYLMISKNEIPERLNYFIHND